MNPRNDILAELQELSPALYQAKMQVRKPEVPDGYFEGLSDQILQQLQEPKLEVLSGLDKHQNLGMPAGYFDTFGDRVMQKIRQQETEVSVGRLEPARTKVRAVYFRRLAAAAALSGIILLGFLMKKTPLPADDCTDTLACLTREEIRQYVQENVEDFETGQIQEAFQPVIITPEAETAPLPAETNPAPVINEEQIEQYLEDNPATIDFEDEAADIF